MWAILGYRRLFSRHHSNNVRQVELSRWSCRQIQSNENNASSVATTADYPAINPGVQAVGEWVWDWTGRVVALQLSSIGSLAQPTGWLRCIHPLNANACQLTTVYLHARWRYWLSGMLNTSIYLSHWYLNVMNNYSTITGIGLTLVKKVEHVIYKKKQKSSDILLGSFAKCATRVRHVVNEDSDFVANVANEHHRCNFVCLLALLVN